MKEPKITVLMPVFKTPREYLMVAIDSIFNQTFTDFELLLLYEPVIDDGIQEVLSSIVDERLNVIYMEKNAGLPRSLNEGLDRAKGKYIARMDADDQCELDRLEKQYAYMEQHEEVAVLGGALQVMGTNRFSFNHKPTRHQRQIGLLFQNYGVAHPTAMFRKSFFDEKKLRYNEEIRGSEDYYLWTDVIKNDGIIDSIKDTVLHYRVSEGQASDRLAVKMIEWDSLAKRNLWQAYGTFSEEEVAQASNIVHIKVNVQAEVIYKAFCKLLESKRLKEKMNLIDIQKELAFWWTYGALLRYKHGQGRDFFSLEYLFHIVPIKCWRYVVVRLWEIKKESV